ncbi:hypothetical protein Tco_0494810 [Tanacetum coccineum]
MRIGRTTQVSGWYLDDVRSALNDRLKGIRMEYLPQTFWNQRDKANARAMIQAIDKRLKTRRIMRSLERFVGGRPYGGYVKMAVELKYMFQDFRYSDTTHLSRSVKVLKLKNFKKDATLKLFKNDAQDHNVKYKFKEQAQSKKSMITTTYSQEKSQRLRAKGLRKHSMLGLKFVNWSDLP